VLRGVALAAAAMLGQAGEERSDSLAPLLTEAGNGACLQRAKLNLHQCLAAAGPLYEDVYCTGRHAMGDTGQCIVTAAGGGLSDGVRVPVAGASALRSSPGVSVPVAGRSAAPAGPSYSPNPNPSYSPNSSSSYSPSYSPNASPAYKAPDDDQSDQTEAAGWAAQRDALGRAQQGAEGPRPRIDNSSPEPEPDEPQPDGRQ
jgi:hypothetical protein